MQLAIEARLTEAGMLHYETSAYARPLHASRHNLNYWQFGDYLASVPARTASFPSATASCGRCAPSIRKQ